MDKEERANEQEGIRGITRSPLSRTNSEFTLVLNNNHDIAQRKFGLQCVNTMGELSERISNNKLIVDDQDDDEAKCGSLDDECSECSDVNAESEKVHKPLLVELHPFPGFSNVGPTPLPAKLQPLFVLKIVLLAQKESHIKPSFRVARQDLFLSKFSQNILQDTFWWFFCHRFQNKSSIAARQQMFKRLAGEYIQLLITWTGSLYEDKLFVMFADLMSQAVYSSFYHAFSASYLHFNAEFCDELIALLHLWMMGVKRIPRMWEMWNFSKLHPQEGLKGNNSVNSGNSKTYGERLSVEDKAITKNESKMSPPHFKKRDTVENMMHEITSVLDGPEKFKRTNSCVVGSSGTFHKVVFDVYGRSPLVEHFLASRHLLRQSGCSTLVQRTEIRTLPPLGAETYQDLIENVRCRSRQRLRSYRATSEYRQREHKEIISQNKIDQGEFFEYADGILTNHHEIRKMSALLRTDNRNEEKMKVGKSSKKSTPSGLRWR